MTDQPTEQLLHVDPAELIIGTNIRTDTDAQTDGRQFAASIRARGVLEAITCHHDVDGRLVVLRGQRRAVLAARVGTPSGTVPVRVVDQPSEADRITDQLGENLHRQSMSEADVCGAVEQLALLGVSAAQMAKRVAIPRAHVDAALALTKAPAARGRLQQGMTLEDALVFAEFDADPDATARLEQAATDGRPLAHVAQQLRDTTAERVTTRAEINRLRGEGLPVVEPVDVPTSLWRHRLRDLVHADTGETVTEAEVAALPTAAIVVDVQSDVDSAADGDSAPGGAIRAIGEWVVLDAEAAGLVPTWQWRQDHRRAEETAGASAAAEAHREAKSAERRRVIANNKAWDSAETVRREWLAAFCSRRTPPAGGERLISAGVLLAEGSLSRAMSGHHRLLRGWLGLEPYDWRAADQLPNHLSEVHTPKRHTMLVLAAVLAAWEEALSREAWRRPDPWNARVLTAITGWGYEPSPVEQLMTAAVPTDATDTTETDTDTDTDTDETDQTDGAGTA